MTSKLLASAACLTLSLFAAAAQAQTPAPAPAAPSPVAQAAKTAEGAAPVIPGICVYSQDAVVGTSLVGKYVGQRLQQLDAQSNAELNDIMNKIQADNKALAGQAATMQADALQQARGALQQRYEQFQQLAQIRQREMQLTQQTALQQINQNLDPLLIDAFSAHKCSILIDRSATALAATGMDVTVDAVARLDSKIQQFPFDRVTIPEDGAQAAAPATAAAPARAPAAKPAAGTSAKTKK
jgi:Skp family chaperone for outer membrane proteins